MRTFKIWCFVILFWLKGCSDSKDVRNQRPLWLKGCAVSKTVLTPKLFWRKGCSDSQAVLTQRPFCLKGRSDSKAVLTQRQSGEKGWPWHLFSQTYKWERAIYPPCPLDTGGFQTLSKFLRSPRRGGEALPFSLLIGSNSFVGECADCPQSHCFATSKITVFISRLAPERFLKNMKVHVCVPLIFWKSAFCLCQ